MRRFRALLAQAPVAALVLLFAAAPLLLANPYHLQVLTFIGIYIILALSLNLLNGYVGLLSIGHAAFYAVGAYASAKLTMAAGLPWILALPASGAVAGLFGWLLARPTLRLSGIYLTLVTLGFHMILFLVLQNWMGFTNGPLGIMDIPPPSLFGVVLSAKTHYYYLALALVLLTLESMRRLLDCRFGRALTAIRDNELAAEAAGVDTTRVKVQAFVVAAFYAGIAGSFYAHFVKYVSPDSFTINESFILLAMLAFGGQGNLLGPMVGAAALILLPELFRPLQEVRMFVYGGILIVMMLVRREGLFGGRAYRLRLTCFDPPPAQTFRRGDKFLPES